MKNSGRGRVYCLIIAGGVFGAAWLGRGHLFPDRNPQQESAEHLRGMLTQGDSRESRADAAAKLGEMGDEQSMPVLLESMEDPDPLIRGRAAAAVRKIMKADYFFRADDSPQRQQQILAAIKKDWEAYLRYKNRPAAASPDSRGRPQ